MSFIKRLLILKQIQLKDYEIDKKKGIPVRINPDSYVAKEIEYQTVLLKDILHELSEIKMLLQRKK